MNMITSLTDKQLAYSLARIGVGVNFLAHGLVRFPKIEGFAGWISKTFADTPIPKFAITGFGYSLPFIEFGLGALLILGFFTRYTLAATILLITALIFGSCLIEQWHNVGVQMIYLGFLAALLAFRQGNNSLSVDQFRGAN